MNAQALQGKKIVVVEAKTCNNSMSKKSRFTNQEFVLGSIIYERYDGVFFENIVFENCEWRPFLRFENNTIDLDNMNKKNAATIIIKKYETI